MINFVFWLSSVNGDVDYTFGDDKYVVNTCTFNGVYDGAHPDNPLGYIDFEQ